VHTNARHIDFVETRFERRESEAIGEGGPRA